jgi:serine/threonine protein kinase
MGACIKQPQLLIITEYLPKGNLQKLLAKKDETLPWKLRVSMALDVAKGMAYLHGMVPPIIHRDLKSSNLLVDDGMHLKISDFGFSRVKEDTITMTLCGTVSHTAPEVIQGTHYTEKADIYGKLLLLLVLLLLLSLLLTHSHLVMPLFFGKS